MKLSKSISCSRKLKSLTAISLLTLALSGCSMMHTEYERPQLANYTFKYGHLSNLAKENDKAITKNLKVNSDQTQNVAKEKVREKELSADLWEKFNDPYLTALTKEALERNSDYRLAIINVKKALVEANITDTNLIPTLNSKLTSGISKELSHGSSSQKTSSSSLGLSYELDLFGRLSAERKEAALKAEASEYDALSARLTLIATLANVYWNIVYYKDAIDLSIQNIKDSKDTFAIMQDRYNNGDISELELVEARRDVIDMQTGLAENETSLKNNITALNTLLAKSPDSEVVTAPSLKGLILPHVKDGLTADALRYRPDLAAMESRLKAQIANVDVNRLSMYPTFNLTASVSGGKVGEIAEFFENPVGSIAGMLAFPFLNYYQRSLDIDLASLDKDSQEIKFVQLYYQALGEVDDALKAIELYNIKVRNAQHTLQLNKKREEIYLTQYNLGKVPLKDYLDAQTQRRNSEQELLKNKVLQLNNLMTLGKAIGAL